MTAECLNADHLRFRGVFFAKNGCLACELESVQHALTKESSRLDWLEGELTREQEAVSEQRQLPWSLFRRNVPVTRKAIDEAMAATQKGRVT